MNILQENEEIIVQEQNKNVNFKEKRIKELENLLKLISLVSNIYNISISDILKKISLEEKDNEKLNDLFHIENNKLSKLILKYFYLPNDKVQDIQNVSIKTNYKDIQNVCNENDLRLGQLFTVVNTPDFDNPYISSSVSTNMKVSEKKINHQTTNKKNTKTIPNP